MISPKLLATMTLAAAIAGAIGVAGAQITVQPGAKGTTVTTQDATGMTGTIGSGSMARAD